MPTEYERVIAETRRLNKSIIVAQQLRHAFPKYLFITSVVTAVLTAIVIFVVAYFTSDPSLPGRLDANVQEDTRYGRALVCILSVPPGSREVADTRYCLRANNIDVN